MGTRSLTHVIEAPTGRQRKGKVLATIYRQFNGYPEGHGADLLEKLGAKRMVNGIGLGNDNQPIANGAGDLAAQLIRDLKIDHPVGGIYIEPAGTEDHGEEYVYTITADTFNPGAGILLKVESIHGGWGDVPRTRHVLFDGPIQTFDPTAAQQVEEAS